MKLYRSRYDAKQVSYQELLQIFWQQIDPTDAGAILRRGILIAPLFLS